MLLCCNIDILFVSFQHAVGKYKDAVEKIIQRINKNCFQQISKQPPVKSYTGEKDKQASDKLENLCLIHKSKLRFGISLSIFLS